MLNKDIMGRIGSVLLVLIALFLPISKQIVPILIALVILYWLFAGNLKGRIMQLNNWKYVMLFVSFYLLHLLGMIYTTNISPGLFDLEIKMSLFLIPIVFASFPSISKATYYNIGLAFVIGCALASLADLGMGYMNFRESQEIKDMLYGRLSFFHHASYFAMYLALGMAIMLYGLVVKPEELSNSNKRLYLFLVPFFLIMTILLMAKSGILSMGIVILMTLCYLLIKKRFAALGGLSVALCLAILGSLWLAPGVFVRIQKTLEVITLSEEEIDPNTIESTAGRVLVWEQAVKLIKQHPIIGVGTGDVKEALVESYASSGLSGIEEEQLNAHNQFLQSFAALGIFGFLSLVLGLILPAILAVKRGQIVYFMFILIIIVNAMTESILEVQAGVIFYAFFNSLFMFLNPEE